MTRAGYECVLAMNVCCLRLHVLALTLLTIALSACRPAPPLFTPTAPLLPSPAAALSADDYAIYDAVIESNWPGQAVIVMEAATTTNYLYAARNAMVDQTTALRPQTLDAFLAANQITYPLANHFHNGAAYVLLSQADKDKLFTRDLQGSWQRFHSAYPSAPGLLTFSRPGFNVDQTQALVYFQNGNGPLDAAGYAVLLSRQAGGWVVQKQLMIWIA